MDCLVQLWKFTYIFIKFLLKSFTAEQENLLSPLFFLRIPLIAVLVRYLTNVIKNVYFLESAP